MALFVVAPIILVVVYAFTTAEGQFTFDNFSSMLNYASVFGRSFFLALISTAICLLIGYPVAYLLSKEGPRFQKIVLLLFMLPMWMNFLLRTYSWMSILENTGLLNRFLSAIGLPKVNIINTQGAVILGMVYNFLPFMILPIYSVIVKIDRSLIEAAQDLGGSTVPVFKKSTFVISQLLGGSNEMLLGDLIEMQFLGSAYNPHLGSAIALVMMIIVMVCMLVMNRFGAGEEQAVIL